MSDSIRTIIDLVEKYTQKFASSVYLYEKVGQQWEQTTFEKARDDARAFGAGLMELGLNKGDRAAMLCENRKAWIISELGLLYAAGTDVPLSVKLDQQSDLLFRIRHSESRYIIVSKNQLSKVRAIRSECPLVEKVIILDHIENLQEGEIFVGDIMAKGIEALNSHPEALAERSKQIQPEDIATISYTSGTTANPKGVILTHKNYVANSFQTSTVVTYPRGGRMLLVLPLDHCYAHVVGMYLSMIHGSGIGFLPGNNLRNIPSAFQELRPGYMLSVPTLTRTFMKNVQSYVRDCGRIKEKLFNTSIEFCQKYYREGYNKGRGGTMWRQPIVKMMDWFLFSKIRRAVFGGQMKFFISGAAYLDIIQQRFFYALGIPIMPGYGLSEASPVVCSNDLVQRHVLGTCGKIGQPMEVEIRDEDDKPVPEGEKGEICVKGDNVMAGYWKNPEATAETVRNGWLHTGDMGFLQNGYLSVTGRFKSLLISADGEKYSPEQIEEIITGSSRYIDQLMLFNSQSPYTIAFVVPNRDNLKALLAKLHPGVDPTSEKGRRFMLEKIQSIFESYRSGQVNHGAFPERWLPAAYCILPEPFSNANHQLNATGKLVRRKVEADYKERMDYAFTPAGKPIANPMNMETI